jgi:predicted ATPase/DNA-binding SARP family transcriptional activator
MLRIYLFGHLRVLVDEQPLKLAALPRTAPLWAYLLLRRAEVIPRDHLAYLLWPDSSEAEARANLRRHLHDLRRALPPAPDDRPWLLADAGSVRWNPAAAYWLDVDEFERLSANPNRLTEAVAIYAGELLPNIYDDWALAERERLSNLYAADLRQLVALDRARGDFPQALDYARQLLQHDPLREDVARELIALRYAAGDRGGALAEYQRLEQRLRDELGVAPMPETSALYQAITHNAPTSAGAVAAPPAGAVIAGRVAGPSQRRPTPPSNLPSLLTSFVGREPELAALRGLIGQPESRARLLTLTGPGGTGKTRLSLEVAGRLLREAPELFPDGVFFVGLAAIEDSAFVAPALAAALDVRESGSRPLADSLKDFLREKRLLLVLDNFEQVVDAAPLVAELLTAAPGLRTIVTSRALLQLYGEYEFPVPPLDLPPTTDHRPPTTDESFEDRRSRIEDRSAASDDLRSSVVGRRWSVVGQYAAVALFVERARAANSTFALADANAATVAEICVRLDGLPLAIELAAARSRLFEPQALLARLSGRLDFLTTQARNLASRQQTLRATIDWSYNLLTAVEQALFARLAVFAGVFTIDAAEAVTSELRIENEKLRNRAPGQTLLNSQFSIFNLVDSLVNQSMVRQLSAAGPDGEPRFRLLLTLREYAWERLEQRGEVQELQRRHADFFVQLAERAEPELQGQQPHIWLMRLTAQHDNLRAALEWTLGQTRDDVELGVRLAGALWRFWSILGNLSEGRNWIDRALAMLDAQPDDANQPTAQSIVTIKARAKALSGAGVIARQQGDFAAGRPLLEESLKLWRGLQDAHGLAYALFTLGMFDVDQENYKAARRWLEESLALWRSAGDSGGIGRALRGLGMAQLNEGDVVAARRTLEECLTLMRATKDTYGVAVTLSYLGLAVLRQRDYAAARPLLQESLAAMWQLENKIGVVEALEGLAGVAAQTEQPARAARLFGAAEALRVAVGAPLSPADRTFIEPDLIAARSQLDAAVFDDAWAAGATLNLDQLVSYALGRDAAGWEPA